MNNPLISIVICCHNRADMLPKTLNSVFSQTYQPVEIIVLDDGSSDSTPELMERYSDKIRYYWQENQGVTKTRTNACKFAKGEYIAFMDDDDLMPEGRITTLYNALNKFPQAIFATGDFEIIDDNGNLTGKRWLPRQQGQSAKPILYNNGHEAVLWPHVAATVHTSLFKRSDGEKINWFNEQYKYASEDKDFFARLGLLGPIIYVPKVVSLYRRGHDSLTSTSLNSEYEQLLLYKNHILQIPEGNISFKKQLQFRLLITLIKIASNKASENSFSKYEAQKRVNEAFKLISLKDKLRYFWNVQIKMRIKKLFQIN